MREALHVMTGEERKSWTRGGGTPGDGMGLEGKEHASKGGMTAAYDLSLAEDLQWVSMRRS
jgi:hypothetical protein